VTGGGEGGYGCDRCWPLSADAAWTARAGLRRVAEPIDESHFRVMVLACPHCGHCFLSIFTETIDWVDGEDPQHWTLMPVTEAEAADLIGSSRTWTEAEIGAVGPGRRCLRLDHHRARPRRIYWGTGIVIGPHD
jgi:hypothetical protein